MYAVKQSPVRRNLPVLWNSGAIVLQRRCQRGFGCDRASWQTGAPVSQKEPVLLVPCASRMHQKLGLLQVPWRGRIVALKGRNPVDVCDGRCVSQATSLLEPLLIQQAQSKRPFNTQHAGARVNVPERATKWRHCRNAGAIYVAPAWFTSMTPLNTTPARWGGLLAELRSVTAPLALPLQVLLDSGSIYKHARQRHASL